MKIVVSLSVHEEPLCVVDQCLNYRQLGGIDAIVVHVNALGTIDPAGLADLLAAVPALRGRVWVNPVSLPLSPMAVSPAHTAILHRAHLANFGHLEALGLACDVFCLDASNSLLVRPGLRGRLVAGEGVFQYQPEDWWPWRPAVLADPVAALAGGALRRGQHEGSFFRRDTFARMAAWIAAYEAAADGPGEFPREEILFPTAYRLSAEEGAEPFDPYVLIRWGGDLSWSAEEVAAILRRGLPANPAAFGIKRIPRRIDDPLRVMIGEHFGYRDLLPT